MRKSRAAVWAVPGTRCNSALRCTPHRTPPENRQKTRHRMSNRRPRELDEEQPICDRGDYQNWTASGSLSLDQFDAAQVGDSLVGAVLGVAAPMFPTPSGKTGCPRRVVPPWGWPACPRRLAGSGVVNGLPRPRVILSRMGTFRYQRACSAAACPADCPRGSHWRCANSVRRADRNFP
jgi:hypothetical protein